MPRTSRWNMKPVTDGVMEVEITSWKYFHDFVRQEMLDFFNYVWRGQRDSQWTLESSLDRQLRNNRLGSVQKTRAHLNRFKQSVRGRRGQSPVKIEDDNEWWALGQHHGLATPLLDWTESPFVALYFAFESAQRPAGRSRAIWAVGSLGKKNKEIIDAHKTKILLPSIAEATLEFIRPFQDENARLVAQAGLFTKAPLGETVDGWVRSNFTGESQAAHLLKISVPELGRTDCLRTLNKMNINHLSLFPDMYGSSLHCNKALEIDKY